MDRHNHHDKPSGDQKDAPRKDRHRDRRDQHTKPDDPERRVHQDTSRAQQNQHNETAKHPSEAPALSSDKDYVRNWLAQTKDDAAAVPSHIPRARSRPANGEPAYSADFERRLAALQEDAVPRPHKRRRRHNPSSDSSLLQVPERKRSQHLKEETRLAFSEGLQEHPSPPPKNHRTVSSDAEQSSESATKHHIKEIFEKRPRHKTREDLYETKKAKKHTEDGDVKIARKKREKKGDRSKAAKKAGEDLMQNFSSKSIAQERLTIRPAHGPGLFSNGRASSPARRRGLPDLAFSEMEFLHNTHGPQVIEKGGKIASKFWEKEKRKATRTQKEISTFFIPNRLPLQEISPNKQAGSKTPVMEDRSIYAKQLKPDRNRSIHDRSPSFDIDGPHQLDRQPRPSLDRYRASPAFSPPLRRTEDTPRSAGKRHEPMSGRHRAHSTFSPPVRQIQDVSRSRSTSRVSGVTTSYVSWSSSVIPQQEYPDRRPASPTPDSVWQSIENTGIFKDTGIARTPHSPPRDFATTVRAAQGRRNHQEWPVDPNERTAAISTIVSGDADGHHGPNQSYRESPVSTDEQSNVGFRPQDQVIRQLQQVHMDQPATSRKRVVVEHFDPKIGWHEEPKLIPRNEMTSAMAIREEMSPEAQTVPLSREQIVSHARVKMPKRPSTTLPVVRPVQCDARRRDVGGTVLNLRSDVPPNAEFTQACEAAQQVSMEAPTPEQAQAQFQDQAMELPHKAFSASLLHPQQGIYQYIGSFQARPQGDHVAHEVSTEANIPCHTTTRLHTSGHSSETVLNRLHSGNNLHRVTAAKPTGNKQSPNPNAQHNLPIQGSWLSNVPPAAAEAATESPAIRPEPLYIHQIQRQPSRIPSNPTVVPSYSIAKMQGTGTTLDRGYDQYYDEEQYDETENYDHDGQDVHEAGQYLTEQSHEYDTLPYPDYEEDDEFDLGQPIKFEDSNEESYDIDVSGQPAQYDQGQQMYGYGQMLEDGYVEQEQAHTCNQVNHGGYNVEHQTQDADPHTNRFWRPLHQY